jgi:hypothetical protein
MKLSTLERRWVHEEFDTMYPPGADPRVPLGARDCDIDGYIDDVERQWPTFSIVGFRVTVVIIAVASIFLLGTWRTFHRLTTAERLRVLEKLYVSRFYVVRSLVILIKASAGILYGSSPRVRQHLLRGATEGREHYSLARIAKGA